MAAAVPPSLRKIAVFLRRANEVASDFPIVSYNCRQFFVQQALEIQKTLPAPEKKAVTKFVLDVMDQLEKEKLNLVRMPEFEKAAVHHLEFALRVFDGIDTQDREGNIDEQTASGFLAASQFFEALQIFGPLPAEVAEKKKYAKWKASSITKALKSGVAPTPGAPGEAAALERELDELMKGTGEQPNQQTNAINPETNAEFVVQSAPAVQSAPVVQSAPAPTHPAKDAGQPAEDRNPRQTNPAPKPIPTKPVPSRAQEEPKQERETVQVPAGFVASQADITFAERNAKYAISSLQFSDVPSAVKFLEAAVLALKTGKKN